MEDNAKKIYIGIGVAVLIFIAGVGLHKMGYRLVGFSMKKIGYAEMTIPLINTSIFVDQSQKIVTTKDNEKVIIHLSPTTHSVIVARDGYYPWKKDFKVPSNEEIELSPIFVTVNASGEIITTKDPEYYKIKNIVAQNKLPTKNSPVKSKDETTKVWVEGKTIISQIGNATSTVLESPTTIRNVEFYKNRSDAILFSAGDSVIVVEINKAGTQNFIPVYVGTLPTFSPVDANSIYVADGNTLMQVII